MHPAAYEFCETVRELTGDIAAFGVDLGGRDVNGTARELWPHIRWTIVDKEPSNDPAIICADAAFWEPEKQYELALCTEVFEHTPNWPLIIKNAHRALVTGGQFVVTCASIGRPPHSAEGDGPPKQREWYKNLKPDELGDILYLSGFLCQVTYNPITSDAYAYAIKM